MITRHIAAMYDEAARLARWLETADSGDVDPALDRIDNLVAHARAELEDERLRARDGWPVV